MRAVVVLADGVYSIPKSRVSLLELIRHNCPNSDDISFRYIQAQSCSDLCVILSSQIEDLYTLRERSDEGQAYVLCGLNECGSGYSIPIFSSHISGMISELMRINYNVVFVNCEIKNGLRGKIGGWVKRCNDVIAEACLEYNCDEIMPAIELKFERDCPIVPVDGTRDIVTKICYHIENQSI